MPDRPPRRDGLRGGDNGVGVDAVMLVEIGEAPGLSEMLDAERARAMARNGTEPSERRWMAIEHGDQPAMQWHVGQKPLDMRPRMH